MTDIVLQTKNLTKKYGNFTAVDNLNLTVHAGEIFGLLGPNGAGKTTTILMLLGLTEPTAGEVRVLGLDPARNPLQVKAQVGYLPDQVGFYDKLSARENLIYTAKLNGLPRAEAYRRIDDALARMGLADVADKAVRKFSRGMRQRLGVAEVLIKQPKLIIMDEPTMGLDPEGAREFLDIIRQLKGEGITILLSSHLLFQVQSVCDRVGLFNAGKMVLEGSVPSLARQVLGGAYRINVEVENPDHLVSLLKTLPGVVNLKRENGRVIQLETRDDLRTNVAQAVIENGGKLLSLSAEVPSLDDIYARYFETEVAHGTAN